MLAFFFLTEVVISNWRGAGVFRGKGGLPSTMATIMVGSIVIGISAQNVVGYSTEYVGYG